MLNLNKANRNALLSIIVLMGIIVFMGMFRDTSGYQPRPITITPVRDGSLFDLEHNIECTPGRERGSPYTKSLTPGGLCDSQKLISDLANYQIVGGIGESLF